MRYTFLPFTEQQAMKKEYRLRVAIVALFFMSIAVVVGAASLFPAYIYATLEEKLHLDQVAQFRQSTDATSIKSNQQQLSISAGLLKNIEPYASEDVFYQIASSLAQAKGSIKILSFNMDRSNPATMVLNVSGIAPSRAELLAFKARLLSIRPKASVNLPVSTLARSVDLPFSLQATIPLK